MENRTACGPILIAAFLVVGLLACGSARAAGLFGSLRWGEGQRALLAQFAGKATVLARPIDFGDSYAQIVLRNVEVGGVRLIAWLQIDKRTGSLKRIQLERPRHGVNPAAFRAVVGALVASYGRPAAACAMRPAAENGYQASAELDWAKGGDVIRAIFRDTTLEALEGCWWSIFAPRPCGLTGQMLVRISPKGADRPLCTMPG